jgi:hypothetical protein
MNLTAFACPGGVVLDWSVPEMAGVNRITVLRGATAEIPTTWPPSDGVTKVIGASTTDLASSDGSDATEGSSSAWYRAVAYTGENVAVAASAAKGVTTVGVGDLGALGVSSAATEITFSWSPFAGSGDCFSYYKLVASRDDMTPSYLEGSQYLAAIGEQPAGGVVVPTEGLASGTWYVRLQAIRSTSLGKFVVAETTVNQFVVP